MRVQPSGKRVRLSGVTLARVRGGKVVEYWEFADEEDFLSQLAGDLAVAS